jgi:hypothetical protein
VHREAPIGGVEASRYLRGIENASNVPLLDGAAVSGSNYEIVGARMRRAQPPGNEQTPQRRNDRHDPQPRFRLGRAGVPSRPIEALTVMLPAGRSTSAHRSPRTSPSLRPAKPARPRAARHRSEDAALMSCAICAAVRTSTSQPLRTGSGRASNAHLCLGWRRRPQRREVPWRRSGRGRRLERLR